MATKTATKKSGTRRASAATKTRRRTSASTNGGWRFDGTKVAEIRERKGMKRDELAEALGVATPSVWVWEKDRGAPTVDRLAATATALGAKPGDFFVQEK